MEKSAKREEQGRGEGVDKVDGVGCWLDSGTNISSKKDNITIITVFI